MSRFGLVGPTYESQSPNTDAELCMNFYPEIVESGAGNAPIVLHPTGGTKRFVDLSRTIVVPGNGVGAVENVHTDTQTSNTVSTPAGVPTQNPTWALFLAAVENAYGSTVTPAGGWTNFGTQSPRIKVFQQVVSASVAGSAALTSSAEWASGLVLFQLFGSAPTLVQEALGAISSGPSTDSLAYLSNVTKGDLLIAIVGEDHGDGGDPIFTVTDTQEPLVQWTKIISVFAPKVGNFQPAGINMFTKIAAATGPNTVNFTHTNGAVFGVLHVYEVPFGSSGVLQNGPIRGQINIASRSFAVSGGDFDEVLANGTFINWGTVANDAKPVTMAATPQQLLLASAGTAYVFNLMTNTLTAIPGVTFSGPVSQAAVCDSFFILTIKDSKTFYVSAPLNANDWVTNGSAIVSVFPNNIVSTWVFQRQVWFFSDTQSVVYYDSGNIFPFDVNPNAFIEAGSAAKDSVVTFNNSIGWVGADARGKGKIWMAQGYTPTRISNHAVEFALQGYTKIDDAVGFSFQDQGHEFACWYFPTPSVTWCYDASTGMWHREGFWVGAIGSFQAAHRQNHVESFGRHLVGDWQSAKIYEMHIPVNTAGVWTFADDDGAPLHRVRRAPHISNEQKRLYLNELNVYVETGIAPTNPLLDGAGNPREPSMDLRVSRDGGHTWSDPRTRGCGLAGQYKNRVRWLRLGQARDFVMEIHVSDPIGWRITDAYINPPQAGSN